MNSQQFAEKQNGENSLAPCEALTIHQREQVASRNRRSRKIRNCPLHWAPCGRFISTITPPRRLMQKCAKPCFRTSVRFTAIRRVFIMWAGGPALFSTMRVNVWLKFGDANRARLFLPAAEPRATTWQSLAQRDLFATKDAISLPLLSNITPSCTPV